MPQAWTTPSEISTALARFERQLDWQRPALHGMGFAPSVYSGDDEAGEPVFVAVEGEIEFVRVNDREHLLAAAALATVTGWRGGAGSVRLDQIQLGQAIDLLAPAEACREVPHPNLRVWREIQEWHLGYGTLLAVFDPDPDELTDDPYVIALREVVASGRQAVPAGEVHMWPSPHPLHACWEARWPQVRPISHHLRSLDDRWVRFHSLPDSQRYAGNEAEYDTILHRHHTVLDDLRGQVTDLRVITLEIAHTPVPGRRAPDVAELLPDAECWSTLSWPELEPMLAFAHSYVSNVTWEPGFLSDLLRRIADDVIPYVIIGPPDLSWLYAPYDGGADVLLATTALRDNLRDRYRCWLSRHPSGL